VRVPTGTWYVDPAHSSVEFEIKHMMIATVRGRFREFEGTLIAAEDIADSRAYGVVKAASIDSNQTDRDAHLPLEATVKGAHRDPWGNDRVGMRARGTINRKDFGSPGNRCSRAAPSSSVKGCKIFVDVSAVTAE
jgi:polyisoprenoid-binding protein YceI